MKRTKYLALAAGAVLALSLSPAQASTPTVNYSGGSASVTACSVPVSNDSTPATSDCTSLVSIASGATKAAAAVFVPKNQRTHIRDLTTNVLGPWINGPVWVSVTANARVWTEAQAPLFLDEFDGPAGQTFNHDKWRDWSNCTYVRAYGDIQCGDTETLDGQGNLRIPTRAGNASAISTATKFDFVYGEMSAWIKMPKEAGTWPSFWSLNSEPTATSNPLPAGEIDVMEFYSYWPNSYHRVVHNWDDVPNQPDQSWHSDDAQCGFTDLTTEYHKYTARVVPGKITFAFDNKVCATAFTKEQTPAGKRYAFGPDQTARGNWLILAHANGGGGQPVQDPTGTAYMDVARVEVQPL
jgi:beta-glucanase (GH16 family)